MRQDRITSAYGFNAGLTRLGKRLLTAYATIYILELVATHWLHSPIAGWLFLYPPSHPNFHIFQILTHPFIHHPNEPIGFLLNCLVFYFFAGAMEQRLGRGDFLTLYFLSSLAGALTGLLVGGLTGYAEPMAGILPALLALVVVFGLIQPDATLLLMFILPIKARYISYATILIALLTFLARVNPNGAHQLGAIGFGWLWLAAWQRGIDAGQIHIWYLQWRLRRKKARFRVIDGHKEKDDEPPTYH